ncbi:MAG: phosphatidylglycerophosphatase A [Halanaerobiales bacterium]|nr:phosphatidylglycerophosphatase A [Halanaerobiales bacterium]
MESFKTKLTAIIASCFYIGYIPGAPGTYGSLFALLLISQFEILTNLTSIILFILIGLIFSTLMEKQSKKRDDQRIIIDEFAGMLITFYLIPINFLYLVLGFVLFRLYDIFKPYPIKKLQKLPAGWGIMVDDILAGLYARIVLYIIIILI